MYLDSMFKVVEVTYNKDGERVIRLQKWPRCRRRCTLIGTDVKVEVDDIIHAKIQNHDPDTGWKLEKLHGFHYDDSKPDCTVCR